MKINTEKYVCSICGKGNVKLWHPFLGIYPLLCSKCAEKRQTPLITYTKKWEVNEDGKIPTYIINDIPSESMTNRLNVNLVGIPGITISFTCTSMVPAYPIEGGYFYCYNREPEELRNWWNSLPTR